MPTPENARIAVLIDADNTSKKYVEALIKEVAKYGTPTVKRAYGDWTSNHLNGWKNELNRNAIVPIQQFAYTQGKNSTDSLLIIDAMDLLYTGNLDGFAIVSSDSDFTSLATRLREAGKAVYGLGQRKTPEPFRTACTRFIFLEVLEQGRAEPVRGAGGERPDAETAPLPDLQKLLTSAIDATSQDDGWAHLGSVGNYLSNTYVLVRPAQLRLRAADHPAARPGLPGRRHRGLAHGPAASRSRRRRRSSPASGRRKKAAAKKS